MTINRISSIAPDSDKQLVITDPSSHGAGTVNLVIAPLGQGISVREADLHRALGVYKLDGGLSVEVGKMKAKLEAVSAVVEGLGSGKLKSQLEKALATGDFELPKASVGGMSKPFKAKTSSGDWIRLTPVSFQGNGGSFESLYLCQSNSWVYTATEVMSLFTDHQEEDV